MAGQVFAQVQVFVREGGKAGCIDHHRIAAIRRRGVAYGKGGRAILRFPWSRHPACPLLRRPGAGQPEIDLAQPGLVIVATCIGAAAVRLAGYQTRIWIGRPGPALPALPKASTGASSTRL
jgi:hypothetical protein